MAVLGAVCGFHPSQDRAEPVDQPGALALGPGVRRTLSAAADMQHEPTVWYSVDGWERDPGPKLVPALLTMWTCTSVGELWTKFLARGHGNSTAPCLMRRFDPRLSDSGLARDADEARTYVVTALG